MSFTKEDLQKEFMHAGSNLFEDALEKMEDNQLVGNMGDYYKWID